MGPPYKKPAAAGASKADVKVWLDAKSLGLPSTWSVWQIKGRPDKYYRNNATGTTVRTWKQVQALLKVLKAKK
jgi:hypothetical protein